jgi:hypothetical protein
MTNIDHVARSEKRLRRCIEKHGRARQGYAFHYATGPHYPLTKDQFSVIVAKLHEEGFLEVLSGSRPDTLWLVRKDLVDQTIRDGVTS